MRRAYLLPKSARAQMLHEALRRHRVALATSRDGRVPAFGQKAARQRAECYEDVARELACSLIAPGCES